MDYNKNYFNDVVSRYGEVFFVLDSDREYEVHGTDSFVFKSVRGGADVMVRVEGLRGDEFLVVEFPLDAIEHHYTHREV